MNFVFPLVLDRVVSENSITTEITEDQPVASDVRSRFRTVNLAVASAELPDGRDESNFWMLHSGLSRAYIDGATG